MPASDKDFMLRDATETLSALIRDERSAFIKKNLRRAC